MFQKYVVARKVEPESTSNKKMLRDLMIARYAILCCFIWNLFRDKIARLVARLVAYSVTAS